MNIRPYRPTDCVKLTQLFFNTVHTVCARDYTPAQLDAWAPPAADTAAWDANLRGQTTLVAEEGGTIWGFGSIHSEGYLDLLYVAHDHQGRGVGGILCAFLEGLYPVDRVTVHASKTAKPFFEHLGYRLLHAQQVERRGQTLTNYVMEKELI